MAHPTVPLLHDPRFGAPHAFTTRQGGVGEGAFASLNLGASVGDDPDAVAENRRRVVASFGGTLDTTAFLHQVHGATVVVGAEAVGASAGVMQGDALVSADPELTLAISVADCLPLFLHDPVHGAVVAAHAGWRGVVAGVVPASVEALVEEVGAEPSSLRALIGPHVRQDAYQVGPEVIDAFLEAGFSAEVARPDDTRPGFFRLSVERATRMALAASGVAAESILSMEACTASEPDRFFSHRRDRGRSGRHWALLRATHPR